MNHQDLAKLCLRSYDGSIVGTNVIGHVEEIVVRSNVAYLLKPTADRLILVFRGSDDNKDWINNVRFGRVRVNEIHRGWRKLSGQIWPDIKQRLRAEHPDTHLTVTGHSLGGALASMINFYAAQNNIDFDSVVLFGSPSPFSRDFSEYSRNHPWAKRVVSYVYGNDAVSKILDNSYVGKQIHLGPKRCLRFRNMFKDHDLSNYIKELGKLK